VSPSRHQNLNQAHWLGGDHATAWYAPVTLLWWTSVCPQNINSGLKCFMCIEKKVCPDQKALGSQCCGFGYGSARIQNSRTSGFVLHSRSEYWWIMRHSSFRCQNLKFKKTLPKINEFQSSKLCLNTGENQIWIWKAGSRSGSGTNRSGFPMLMTALLSFESIPLVIVWYVLFFKSTLHGWELLLS
jgi:hypothetical protein